MTTAMTRATIAIVRVSMTRPYSVSLAVSPDLLIASTAHRFDESGDERWWVWPQQEARDSRTHVPSLVPAPAGIDSRRFVWPMPF